MAIYESEFTKFMRDLLRDKPQLAEEQKKGRAIWWEKKPNPDQVPAAGGSPAVPVSRPGPKRP